MQPKVGDRIEYVVRKGPEKLYLRGVQPSEVVDGPHKLDIDYYMNKQLREPMMRIFSMIMPNATSIFHLYDKDEEARKAEKRKRKQQEKNEAYRKKIKVKDIRTFFQK